jgi:hypothetical protein
VRIAARDAAARRWQLHGPAGASAQAVQPGDEALRPPPDGLACHWPAPAQPAWMRDAFAGGADASGGFTSVVSAHWQGELVALLLFATPHEPAWTGGAAARDRRPARPASRWRWRRRRASTTSSSGRAATA